MLKDRSSDYLLLYIDDMFIASKIKMETKGLKVQLKSEFEMKDVGDTNNILGMEIEIGKGNHLFLSCHSINYYSIIPVNMCHH